jgi:gliding motility-associated-like protein
MNRLILLLAFFLITFNSFSQLSNKHWIPPLHANEDNSSGLIQEHYIYLSTPESTSFSVTVTDGSGNAISGSPFTISQGNPVEILIGNGQPSSMFINKSDVGKVISGKGLILEGIYDFYVSFRVRSQAHAEFLSSKGTTGAGTIFRLGSLPQYYSSPIRNFVSSFMATEDNTTVNLSDYDPNVRFIINSNNTITSGTQTFTLNKGQSVVVSGNCDSQSLSANFTGFIGALLTSDKPIVVNTGNLAGGTEPSLTGNSRQDFNLDQIVPLEQVGTEYVIMKGNGSNNTEIPLVIAHEDNTEIYINGNSTPIAILNAGEYFLIPSSNFQGIDANKNMYINSIDKPFFLYQIVGGDSSNDATNGFFFIPPLNCYWQKSVDLIPSVNRIGWDNTYNSDLILATEVNSVVTINDIVTNATPLVVAGNPNWESYRISGLSGNVKIESTGPLAVGVFGASGNAGFGGYFSGFGASPKDVSLNVCSSSIIDLFEKIPGNPETGGTWHFNDPDAPIRVNEGIFDPSLDNIGDYYYKFTKSCPGQPNLEIIIKVSVINIIPALNAGVSSNQSFCHTDSIIDLTTLLGTSITPNGQWTYNGSPRSDGMFDPSTDSSGNYTYTLTDPNGVCDPAVATITITLNNSPHTIPLAPYEICDTNDDGDDTNGFASFTLSSNNTTLIDNQTDIASIQYFELFPDAEANTASAVLPNSYYSNSKTIYYRIENTSGCYATGSLDLIVNPLPNSIPQVTLKQCDTDTDAITNFNLTEANSLISTDSNLIFSYHYSLSGAQNNTNFVPDDINHSASNGSVVWARIETNKGCYRTAKVNLVVSTTTIPLNFSFPLYECDDFIDTNDPDDDGIDYFDLTQIESTLINQFPTTQSYTFSYYLNETDALTEQNSITDISSFRNTIPNYQEIWVRMESNLYECAALGPYLKLTVNPLPDTDLGYDFFLCVNPQTGQGSQIIDATPITSGSYTYQWDSNISGLDLSGETGFQYTVTQPGTYTVTVTNVNTSCVNTDEVNVTYSSEPLSFTAKITMPPFSSGTTTIVGSASGGYGIYEYSLDLTNWQSSPTFSDLPNGNYTIYARDIQGCGLLSVSNLYAITYPNYFTPNGDGYNDTWNISNLPSEYDAKILIFDRYGKLIKQISSYGEGWDGTYNGKLLPSTDYWFKVEYKINGSEQEFKSHFSLKR